MNHHKITPGLIFLIYLPCLISAAVSCYPTLSFVTAWIGSFFIFYLTIGSSQNNHANYDHSLYIMRPIVLQQIIFSGFMCCTSIFYFLKNIDSNHTSLATCQRLALLGHASMTTGVLCMTRPLPKTHIITVNLNNLRLGICLTCLAASKILLHLPALSQFAHPLYITGAIAGCLVLVSGIKERSIKNIAIGLSVFAFTLINVLLDGYKEAIIIQFVILTAVAYPHYKKATTLFALPCFLLLLYVLPTFTKVIRKESWEEGKSNKTVLMHASETFFSQENNELIDINNEDFLTNRLSEVSMFIKYIEYVPDFKSFYGYEIIENSLYALIPRAIWHNKPFTEKVAMERVYDAGVAKRTSTVSAKTRPVVDGYLIYGAPGVFTLMLVYGVASQSIYNRAEQLFGGYEIGCIIIFNGLFSQLWRGNTLEFILNNIVYAFILMHIIQGILLSTKVLKKNS